MRLRTGVAFFLYQLRPMWAGQDTTQKRAIMWASSGMAWSSRWLVPTSFDLQAQAALACSVLIVATSCRARCSGSVSVLAHLPLTKIESV